MNVERYGYLTGNNFLNYQFESSGPKGTVKKAVRFDLLNVKGVTYFNLVFGDWDEKKKKINDGIVTNNGDREKVLATVAAIVLYFTSLFPDMIVYAKGNTQSRTRLYQMGINAHFDEVISLLEVYGERNEGWEPFKKNINYDAFMIIRKKQ